MAWVMLPDQAPDQALEGDELTVTIARGAALPDHEKWAAMLSALDDRLAEMLSQTLDNNNNASAPLVSTAFNPAFNPVSNRVKAANHTYSPTLRGLGELSGYLPGGQLSWSIPGVPRHLQGMLGGGLLGAGLGYGAGWLGSRMLPASWNRERLPRTMAILGSLTGVAPGAAALLSNLAKGPDAQGDTHIWSDDSLFQSPPNLVKRFQQSVPLRASGPNTPAELGLNPGPETGFRPGPEAGFRPVQSPVLDQVKGASPGQLEAALDEVVGDQRSPVVKQAVSETGFEVDWEPPQIPVDHPLPIPVCRGALVPTERATGLCLPNGYASYACLNQIN
jgi:hypothetical protein